MNFKRLNSKEFTEHTQERKILPNLQRNSQKYYQIKIEAVTERIRQGWVISQK